MIKKQIKELTVANRDRDISKELLEHRKVLGLSRDQMVEMLNSKKECVPIASGTVLGTYERGERMPPADKYRSIMGISADEALEWRKKNIS